jgi:hypothetical protein
MNQSTTEVIAQILEEWLQERADDMRENLSKFGMTPANSPLAQGIAPTAVVITGEGFTATIELDEYYEFIDQGVGGIGKAAWDTGVMKKNTGKFKFKTPFVSRAMVNSIRDWNARPRTNMQDRGITKKNMNSVAFLTAKKVKRLGIRQTLFFTDATKESYENQLVERISSKLGQKYEISLL